MYFSVSFLELYNDQVTDLLETQTTEPQGDTT
jgi:hypothetical protein